MANTNLIELNRTRTLTSTPTSTPTSTSTSTETSEAVHPERSDAASAAERSRRTTPTSFPFQSLDCYRCAREIAIRVHRAGISDPELRDQATRAAKSAFLNLSEGLPDDRVAMRRKYFLASDGSLHEVVAAVDLAGVIGAVGTDHAVEIQALAVRLRAMLRGLLRGAGRP